MLLQFRHLWNTQRCFDLWCVLGMLTVHGTSGFLILVFMFLKDVFFVFVLDAIFCGTNFFKFQETVWLVKPSWCVHCCSIHQFYWVTIVAEVDLRSGDFLSEKSCRHKLVVSTSFWSWLLNAPSVSTSLKYAALLWFVDALWVCWLFMGLLRFGLWYLYFWKMIFFCVCSWCDLLWYKFFQFPGQCVAS